MQKLTKKKKGLVFLFSFIIIFILISCHKKKLLDELNISPSSPTITVTTITQDSVQLSWTPAVDPDGSVQGYNVYQTTTSKSNYVKVNLTVITGLSYTVTGLTNNTRYYFVLRAVDNLGLESFSNKNELAVCIGAFINTVAGILGTAGATGDGGLATFATLNSPKGLYQDSSGNIFIADANNNAIRKVNASNGKINTVAGILGTSGTSGDGGLATSATLKYPISVFVDSSGNIFIADYNNHAIRKVNASDGKINTVAGTLGTAGTTGDGGLATSATLNNPKGVYVDVSGNIFITDCNNNAIRKVNASNGIINTVAGILGTAGATGDGGLATSATLNNPSGVYVDSISNILIADYNNHAIRKVNASDGKINTVAGILGTSGTSGDGGLATSATLKFPTRLYVDSSGNIYIVDSSNNAIRKVNASNGKINTVAGILGTSGTSGDGGLATSATLNFPSGVYVDSSGNIFIADCNNNAIRKVYNE